MIDGALIKRLKGQFEDRTNAYAAAKAAMEIFNDYVNRGAKRVLSLIHILHLLYYSKA